MNSTLAPTRLHKVLNGLESRGIAFTTASTYGEPGYSTDKPLIIFANWNALDRNEMKAVEAVAEIEWEDEWTTDDENRAFRTQLDSHEWTRAYFEHDGEIVPFDTLSSDPESLCDELRDYGFFHAPGDPVIEKACIPDVSGETLRGFAELVEDNCQTGFHPGQDDSPAANIKDLPQGEYFFRIADKGQFDITWQVWRVLETSEDCPSRQPRNPENRNHYENNPTNPAR